MKRGLKLSGDGTEGGTISNSTIRIVVQDYWRKLGYPGALRDNNRRPKNVIDSKDQARGYSSRKRVITHRRGLGSGSELLCADKSNGTRPNNSRVSSVRGNDSCS